MLNNRQKAQLKAHANSLKPLGQIGKEGLSINLLEFLDTALESHELIKIKVLNTCSMELNELKIEIIRYLSADLVQTIGRILVLYRPNKEKKRIKLVK